MPKNISTLDPEENYGNGQGINGNVANIINNNYKEKQCVVQKSLSFDIDENLPKLTRDNTLDGNISNDDSIRRRKKKKKHGDLYDRMSESLAEFAGHTR